MSRVLMTDPTSDTSVQSRSDAPQTLQWITAFLFWGQLLIAVGLYAAVSLSPKLLVHSKLETDFLKTQSQLVNLEQQVDELKKVVTALENDPRIIQELARIEIDAVRPGEERISLSSDLTLQSRLTQKRSHATEFTRAWYQPLLSIFAEDHQLRTTSLAVAAALVLISFTFFQPSDSATFSFGWSALRGGASALASRYR